MRYAPDSKLLFIHIPKAAGSSVKRVMKDWSRVPEAEMGADINVDLTGRLLEEFHGYVEHPTVGSVNYAHIPLPVIREHFPATYKLMQDAECFAILRDPKKRFISAVSQHLREFHDVGATHVTAEMISTMARDLVEKVKGQDLIVSPELMHFARQSSYIEDPGHDLPVKVFAIERLDLLKAYLASKTGHDINFEKKNATVRPASGFGGLHKSLAKVGKLVPGKVRNTVFKQMLKTPLYSKSWKSSDIKLDDEILTFIDGYYARDFELHKAAMASEAGIDLMATVPA